MQVSDYTTLSEVEHILHRPGMYVGAAEINKEEDILFVDGRMVRQEIAISRAVEKLFLEVLSNAADNVPRSMGLGVDPGAISVNISGDGQTITIKNEGVPIPVEMHPEQKMWIPQLIFGTLRSGSNFDASKERMGGGVNGLGVKLVSVYSSHFSVQVGDAIRKKLYSQVWRRNMQERDDPQISKYTGTSFVQVSYTLDFAHMSKLCKSVISSYPEEWISLFYRHAVEVAINMRVPVFWQRGEAEPMRMTFTSLEQAAPLYLPENCPLVYWRSGGALAARRKNAELPEVEIVYASTVDAGTSTSWVNGIITREGGVHVEAALKAVVPSLLTNVNGKRSDAEKKRATPHLTQSDVIPHISTLVLCRVPDPSFVGQMKSKLSGPRPKIDVPESLVKKMMEWPLINRLLAVLESKEDKAMKKTDGKKSRFANVPNYTPANLAGSSRSTECCLILTEGLSALAYPSKYISMMRDAKGNLIGKDLFGTLPLTGKILNTMAANPTKIRDNKVINNIKQVLGLREGVDYSKEFDFRTLNYGSLLIAGDADADGIHCASLILCFMYCRFPSLLKRGFVKILRTPIVRVWRKNSDKFSGIKFYDEQEFREWQENEQKQTGKPLTDIYTFRYYKGLGTSDDDEIRDDRRDPREICIMTDDATERAMRLAFDKTLSDDRKKWIAGALGPLNCAGADEKVNILPVSRFIDEELVHYSKENLRRAIPGMDGFKDALRKILHGVVLKWGAGTEASTTFSKTCKEMKVAQLASFVAEETHYPHGEQNLGPAIIGLAQGFVGSNNLPLLQELSQFGTRNLGGKDAVQPRYGFTSPQSYLNFIFRKEDMALLQHRTVEGTKTEPLFYLPIVPLSLLNTTVGIGTGHSTYIPPHDPIDVVGWLLNRLNGVEEPPSIRPSFKGFTGKVVIHARGLKDTEETIPDDNEKDESDHDEENEDTGVADLERIRVNGAGSVMTTYGAFQVDESGTVTVSELPIGRWTSSYRDWLNRLVLDKTIKDYKEGGTVEHPVFQIVGFENPTLVRLRLRKSFPLTNMVLLDEEDRPIHFKSSDELLQHFYAWRLSFYAKRKALCLSTLDERKTVMETKHRFLSCILSGKIEIRAGKSREEYKKEMEDLNLPFELLSKTSFLATSHEDVEKLEEEIRALSSQIGELSAKSPSQIWVQDLQELLEVLKQPRKEVRVRKTKK